MFFRSGGYEGSEQILKYRIIQLFHPLQRIFFNQDWIYNQSDCFAVTLLLSKIFKCSQILSCNRIWKCAQIFALFVKFPAKTKRLQRFTLLRHCKQSNSFFFHNRGSESLVEKRLQKFCQCCKLYENLVLYKTMQGMQTHEYEDHYDKETGLYIFIQLNI